MINYTWDCRTVDVYPQKDNLQNVIYNVHWIIIGSDSESYYTSSLIGTQILETDNIDQFVPINELTNEIITDWVKQAIGAEEVLRLETAINNEIEDKKNPTSITITIAN